MKVTVSQVKTNQLPIDWIKQKTEYQSSKTRQMTYNIQTMIREKEESMNRIRVVGHY